ncbi:MAG: hypothetical protein JWQ11_4000, partial [Rhizobacter sp.]|nr:hypothetical protein [Rhizobacter sp.]
TRSSNPGPVAMAAQRGSRHASADAGVTAASALRPSAPSLPAGSLLMSSAWVRLVGALVLIAVLWLAVGWALAEVAL